MQGKIVVTGIGIISSIGKNVPETLKSLRSMRSGVAPVSVLDTIHKGEIPAGEIKMSDDELKQLAAVNSSNHLTRTAALGIIAAKEAFQMAGFGTQSQKNIKTGVISATTTGGMGKTENHYYDFLKNDKYKDYVYSYECNDVTEKIAELFNATDHMATVSTACSSSANAIMLAARLVKNGIVDRVCAGGTDGLTKFTLNGFNSLKLLDNNICRPFDKNRNGLNIGEGAAYLILESEDFAIKNNSNILCEISGYANTNDAFHQTASSPGGTGAFLAMKKALEVSGIKPSGINYINAHGTATFNNDLSEGIAINNIFKECMPKISSTKPYTGHTLGAAGSMEALFSILSITHKMIIPNLNFKNKIEELDFEPEKKLIENIDIKNVLSNSFGFGGNNTSLVLSKYGE